MRLDTETVTSIAGSRIPDGCSLAGYAALVHGLSAKAPLPREIAVVSRSVRRDVLEPFVWRPASSLAGDDAGSHLLFALRHERMDLLILKRVLDKMSARTVEDLVRQDPSDPARRIAWFFREWLTGEKLDLPDLPPTAPVYALDPAKWHTCHPEASPRHRVLDNLPGTRDLVGLVSRDADLSGADPAMVHSRIKAMTSGVAPHILRHAQKRLLLSDSRSTYNLEREYPSDHELVHWTAKVEASGQRPLTEQMLIDLQKTIFRDSRFFVPGRRHDPVFIGVHNGSIPCPNWIGANHEDLPRLMNGLFAAHDRMSRSDILPICHAASLAFQFCLIHPLMDGNGRLSRYIISHVAAERGLAPKGIILPISAAILRRSDEYRGLFVESDQARMPLIDWRPTSKGNVEVLGSTYDLYAYADFSRACEFTAECIASTLDHDFPNEIVETARRLTAIERVRRILPMNDVQIELLLQQIAQNQGCLSNRRRRKDYKLLTDDEVGAVEAVVREVFEIEPPEATSAPAPGM